jgi:hypothetical protein
VVFFCEDGSYLSVNAALRQEYTGLIHRDVPVFVESGDTMTIRFEVSGFILLIDGGSHWLYSGRVTLPKISR